MGRGCAIEMAAQGGRVMVTDVNEAAARETLDAILAAGGEADMFVCNLRKADEISALMDFTAQRFGGIDTPMLQKYYEAAPDKDAIMSVLTGAHLIPRLGKVEEIAKLACFLASNDSSFINGASYVIDGGTLAWRGMRAAD